MSKNSSSLYRFQYFFIDVRRVQSDETESMPPYLYQ